MDVRGEKTLLKVTLTRGARIPPAGKETAGLGTIPALRSTNPIKSATPAKPWQPTVEQQAFIDEVAKLAGEEQLSAVVKKLQEINPGFDGQETNKIENGKVTQLGLASGVVADIWPINAITCGLCEPRGGNSQGPGPKLEGPKSSS